MMHLFGFTIGVKNKVVSVQAMKAYGEVRSIDPVTFNINIDGGKW
jgi:hypothetical protein